MKSRHTYNRYVIATGGTIEIEHTEEIVSEEPHPDKPEFLIIWTRQQDYGSLGFNSDPEGEPDE